MIYKVGTNRFVEENNQDYLTEVTNEVMALTIRLLLIVWISSCNEMILLESLLWWSASTCTDVS